MTDDPRTPVPWRAAALTALAALAHPLPGQDPASGSPFPAPPPLRLSPARVAVLAAELDTLVERDLAAHDATPNPLADDATFLRRTWLQVVGRIPTHDEAAAFLADRSPDRRRALIDTLLLAPGRVSGEIHWWADLLRVKSRLAPQTSGEGWIHWLEEQIASNRPYDEMVADMLTASGPAHRRGNGATGYLLRDRGMPLDSMANTARVFLGTRLECAQCHDHPFEDWTQRQFYEMAAHFGGIDYKHGAALQATDRYSVRELAREVRAEHGREGQRALRRLVRGAVSGVHGSGTAALPLPDDYAYADARPGEPVAARTIFGDVVAEPEDLRAPAGRGRGRGRGREEYGRHLPGVGSRAAFADWLTGPDNERFAQVIADRTWKRMMGRGIREPVDDVHGDRPASNPALLARLSSLVVELDFDLRELQRVLLHTRTWQRQAVTREIAPEEPFRFEGPLLRRMTAEQLWDSLVTLAVGDADATLDEPAARAGEIYHRYDEIAALGRDELRAAVEREVRHADDPESYRSMRQQWRKERIEQRAAELREKRREARELRAELRGAVRHRDGRRVVEIRDRLGELRTLRDTLLLRRRGLVRASELPFPAPPEHLLRTFGQSDREQIQASHDDATVPQALALLNGFVVDEVLRNGSAAMREVTLTEGAAARVAYAFVLVLGRHPSRDERREWERDVQRRGTRALADLLWVLCNSHEFRLVR